MSDNARDPHSNQDAPSAPSNAWGETADLKGKDESGRPNKLDAKADSPGGFASHSTDAWGETADLKGKDESGRPNKLDAKADSPGGSASHSTDALGETADLKDKDESGRPNKLDAKADSPGGSASHSTDALGEMTGSTGSVEHGRPSGLGYANPQDRAGGPDGRQAGTMPPGGLKDPWDPAAPKNAYERIGTEYVDYRPDYPEGTLNAALWPDLQISGTPRIRLSVVDIGAGTGKFTAQLLNAGMMVTAVEPAAQMRAQLRELGGTQDESDGHTSQASDSNDADQGRNNHQDTQGIADPNHLDHGARAHSGQRAAPLSLLGGALTIVDGTAEATGLPDECADVVTYAQSWHWLEPGEAAKEARRILQPEGHVAIIFNQMDVSIPWVHRLSRIMRSGDVHTPLKPPKLGSAWTKPRLQQMHFTSALKPHEVMGLARTRSSYLKSNAQNRERMQQNLSWYLYDHLGYKPDGDVLIPYYTLVWTARPLIHF